MKKKNTHHWNVGDYAIYTLEGFIPYSCYSTEQVNAIVHKNKELTEREAKLVEALKSIIDDLYVQAIVDMGDFTWIYTVEYKQAIERTESVLKELGVK